LITPLPVRKMSALGNYIAPVLFVDDTCQIVEASSIDESRKSQDLDKFKKTINADKSNVLGIPPTSNINSQNISVMCNERQIVQQNCVKYLKGY